MASIHDSVETVNAAAAAIVAAESRAQPAPIQKRRWGSFWSQYWCFGSQKNGKRIGHAALVPEPTSNGNTVSAVETITHSTSIVLPFIAPPSSPASFLQSDPPTGTHTPAGILHLTSLSADSDSQSGPANVFAIGPYANETQLVSPPVFSAFTTEPSTAAVTPPPEPVQLTTPSSPEVPFAQLLTSSLNRSTRRNSGTSQRNGLSCYDFNDQVYTGSPTGYLISPGSVNSASGTSSPYPIKQPILELRIADASKLFDSEKFNTRNWGSRLDSGSLTPDGVGSTSPSRDSHPLENQISKLATLANADTGAQTEEDSQADPRVSFKFAGEDISPTSAQRRAVSPLESLLSSWKEVPSQASRSKRGRTGSCGDFYAGDAADQAQQAAAAEEAYLNWKHKHSSISFGSVKEFNFEGNSEVEVQDDRAVDPSWWADGNIGEEDVEASQNWTFFPLLQTGVS